MVAKKVARRKPVKRVAKKATAKKAQSAAVTAAKIEATRISLYLRALEKKQKGPGQKRNPAVLAKRIEQAQAQVKARTGLARLQAVQRLRNFQRQATDPAMNGNFGRFEKNFIASAKSYGARNNIDYGTWRHCGVPASVLKQAGIAQTRERVE